MAYSAAFFDLDGTILDSMSIWQNLCKNFMLKHGIHQEINLEEKLSVISIHTALECIIDTFKINISLEDAYRETWQIVETFYREKVELKPGIMPILNELKRKNIPVGIISATEIELVNEALKRVGLSDFFTAGVVSCATLETSKRKPDIFYAMAEKVGSAPENTIIFEDALYAAATAKNAGFALAAVYDPSEKEQEKLAAIADYYCRSWEEFPLDEL